MDPLKGWIRCGDGIAVGWLRGCWGWLDVVGEAVEALIQRAVISRRPRLAGKRRRDQEALEAAPERFCTSRWLPRPSL